MTELVAGHGFHVTDEGAKLIEATVKTLFDKLKRPVTPEDFLEASSDPKAPTYRLFEWDDKRAAHQYRITQARYFIRSVKVRDEGVDARAILNISIGESSGYVPQADAFASTDWRTLVVDRAQSELRVWTKRYEMLRGHADLREVFRVIDVTVAEPTRHDMAAE